MRIIALITWAAFVLLVPHEDSHACQVGVSRASSVNVVAMIGRRVEGLNWQPVYNSISYESNAPIEMFGVKGRGEPDFPIAKYDGKDFCLMDREIESWNCDLFRGGRMPNFSLEYFFDLPRFSDLVPRRDLKFYVVREGGRVNYILRSKLVKNTNDLHRRISNRVDTEVCIIGAEE